VYQKASDGSDKYPELRQSLVPYSGYLFWKWDSNFDIRNHVTYGYNGSFKMDEDSFNKAQKALLRKPYQKDRSPWEAILIPEFISKYNPEQGPQTLILVRFSHALTDGLSIAKMIIEECKKDIPKQQVAETHHGRNLWKRTLFEFTSILLLPFALSEISAKADKTLFPTEVNDLKPLVVRSCKPMPVTLIKELKNKHQSSFQG